MDSNEAICRLCRRWWWLKGETPQIFFLCLFTSTICNFLLDILSVRSSYVSESEFKKCCFIVTAVCISVERESPRCGRDAARTRLLVTSCSLQGVKKCSWNTEAGGDATVSLSRSLFDVCVVCKSLNTVYSTPQVTRAHKPKGDRTSLQGTLVSLRCEWRLSIFTSLSVCYQITVHVFCSPPPALTLLHLYNFDHMLEIKSSHCACVLCFFFLIFTVPSSQLKALCVSVVKCLVLFVMKSVLFFFTSSFDRSGKFQTNRWRPEKTTPNSTVQTLRGKWV